MTLWTTAATTCAVVVHFSDMFTYSEHVRKLDRRHPEDSLLDSAVTALTDLGLEVVLEGRSTSRQEHDVTLRLKGDRKGVRYRVEIRRDLRSATLGPMLLAFSESSANLLIIADYVTAPLADELRRRGVEFIDAAGNTFLKGRDRFIFVSGRRPRVRRVAPKTPRVFRPAGIKIVLALLSVPDLIQAPQRDIARAAGVALGSVAIVLEGLRDLGFVAEIGGARRLVRSDRLLQQWAEAYARLLYPSLALARFAEPKRSWWKHVDLARYGAQWGGETAAAILQTNIVPERTILYADEIPPRLVSQHRLKPEEEGQVIIRRRFWHFRLESPRADIAPPLLVYADLLADGDTRSLEAAKQIRNEYLR